MILQRKSLSPFIIKLHIFLCIGLMETNWLLLQTIFTVANNNKNKPTIFFRFLVIMTLYFFFGSTYNYFYKFKHGINVLPNLRFWTTICTSFKVKYKQVQRWTLYSYVYIMFIYSLFHPLVGHIDLPKNIIHCLE